MKEDEYEENTFGVTRYPCMPSQVALQQMKNRLQLAQLGKKLMKWTALASGRELRRLSLELNALYKDINEEMNNAYIMLARSRYFYPNLNHMVTENAGTNAGVLVESSMKTMSGVKVMLTELKETEYTPYPHLGIEKGGSTIMKTKKTWLELLKRLLLMIQLRATFLMVDLSYKATNKKKNVFVKIVIPKTNETIEYIKSGLEELAREDFFRLRRFLHMRRNLHSSKEERKPLCIEERIIPKSSRRIFKKVCVICGEVLGRSIFGETEKSLERRNLKELRDQMGKILTITRKIDQRELVTADINQFIRTVEELKEKLETAEIIPSQMYLMSRDMDISQLCQTCKEIFEKERSEKLSDKETQTIAKDGETYSLMVESEESIKQSNELSRENTQTLFNDEETDLSITESVESIKQNEKWNTKQTQTVTKYVKTDSLLMIKSEESIKESGKSILLCNEIPTTSEDEKTDPLMAKSEEIIKQSKKLVDKQTQITSEDKKTDSLIANSKEYIKITTSINTTKLNLSKSDSYLNQLSDSEVSTIKTDVKKVTKIVKVEKEDETIIEEKTIVKVKREIRTQVSKRSLSSPTLTSSSDSATRVPSQPNNNECHSYCGSSNIGIVTPRSSKLKIDESNEKQREANSQMLSTLTSLSNPLVCVCESSMTLLSTDLDVDCDSCTNNYKNLTDTVTKVSAMSPKDSVEKKI